MTLRKNDLILAVAALISFFLSVGLWFGGHREEGMYVGIWVPSVIGLGIYVKLSVRESTRNV